MPQYFIALLVIILPALITALGCFTGVYLIWKEQQLFHGCFWCLAGMTAGYYSIEPLVHLLLPTT